MSETTMTVSDDIESRRRARYVPPKDAQPLSLKALLASLNRPAMAAKQYDLLRSASDKTSDVPVFCAGDVSILKAPCVSIVGTREVSTEGRQRAGRLARELARDGITVVSGLAKGVDTAALTSAIDNGGKVAAVIGTPLNKAYPAENTALQEEIYRDHLLLTPFDIGEAVFKANFPKRNRVMAAISDATVIVEASDTSGTLHQAAECVKLERWLFIMKSVADDRSLTWPKKFMGNPRVRILSSTQEIVDAVRAGRA